MIGGKYFFSRHPTPGGLGKGSRKLKLKILGFLVFLNIYVFSFAFDTGLIGRSQSTQTYRSTPIGLNNFYGINSSYFLDEKKYVYDFETQNIVGILEIRPVRDLGRHILLEGKMSGDVKSPKGSSQTSLGKFSRSDYFVVDKYSGNSRGQNYFAKLWNFCSNGLIHAASDEGIKNSGCSLSLGNGMEEFDLESTPGVVAARASSNGRGRVDLRLSIRSISIPEKEIPNTDLARYAVLLNVFIAGLLVLGLIANFIKRLHCSIDGTRTYC